MIQIHISTWLYNCLKTLNWIFYEIPIQTEIAFTCITYLPDCHIHGVCNVNISSVIYCQPLWMVHPCLSGLPIYMSRVSLRGSSNELRSAVCSMFSFFFEKKSSTKNMGNKKLQTYHIKFIIHEQNIMKYPTNLGKP